MRAYWNKDRKRKAKEYINKKKKMIDDQQDAQKCVGPLTIF